MLAPFPDRSRINVPSTLAGELLDAAERLPLYDSVDDAVAAGQPAAPG